MNAISHITHRNLDQLEADIISLSTHINAQEYEFLVLLREFDLRQGWKAYHFSHCSEWLNMKCGMHPGTGREKLRVANALFDFAQDIQRFPEGRSFLFQGAFVDADCNAHHRGTPAGFCFAGHCCTGGPALSGTAQCAATCIHCGR